MLAEFHVSVATRCDVEVALHFVAVERSKYATCVLRPSNLRRLGKPLLPLPRLELVMHIPQILPARQAVLSFSQFMQLFPFSPLTPACRIFPQEISSECAIPGCILHIHVEVCARHGDYNVEIDLEVVGHALFNGEGLRGSAGEPAADLGPGEVDTC